MPLGVPSCSQRGRAAPVVIMGMVTTAPVPDGARGLRSRPGPAGHRSQQQ